jgi:16S rRNA processing protein RimM
VSNFFLIAKILASDGDNGLLKIESYSESPERFNKLKKVYLDFWGEKKKLSIQFVKIKNEKVFIKLFDFNDKESVQDLIGKEIFIDSEDRVPLPAGHYFINDIIGCEVFRNNRELGKVTDIYSLSSNDVYVIRKLNNEELLIPAVAEFIESINIKDKILVLKPGEDFYEDEN